MHRVNRPYRKTSKFLTLLLVIVAGVCALAYTKKDVLPDSSLILRALDRDPIQKPVRAEKFTFDYRGAGYTVEPVADYELWGLVVSHNDIGEFTDIYHDEDSVDIMDICVIWGDNTVDNDYYRIDFWSEPFSCHFHTKDGEVFRRFEPTQLSNSHLLSEEPKVREAIRRVHIGDQIHLQGMLVNYYPEGRPYAIRKSSTRRDDEGNGACEVILVEDFRILKPGNPRWQKWYTWSKRALLLLIAAKILLFVWVTYLECKSIST